MLSISKMMDWENGDLDFGSEIEMFQELVNDGTVWQLQGFYGRRAKWLIDQGYVHLPSRSADV